MHGLHIETQLTRSTAPGSALLQEPCPQSAKQKKNHMTTNTAQTSRNTSPQGPSLMHLSMYLHAVLGAVPAVPAVVALAAVHRRHAARVLWRKTRFDWLMQQWKGKASFGGKEINHRLHRGCLTP